jgi:D-alanyl-D-alanine carboxypeptidase
VLLNDEDATKLFESVTTDMHVYVDGPAWTHRSNAGIVFPVVAGDLPATSALSYMVQDLETSQVYLSKNPYARYPIASITKLVTAAVSSEVIGHGTEVLAQNGEHYMLGDLFYPLLLRSDNVIAQRIEQSLGFGVFVAEMNAYVRAHGMEHTTVSDSSGLSPRNLSTAHDLSLFAKHLYHDKAYLLSITGEDEVTITSVEGRDLHIMNQNKLADDPYFRGGKLGFTDEAGQTSLALFAVPVGDSTRLVSVIILHSRDWKQDTRTLLRWLTASVLTP